MTVERVRDRRPDSRVRSVRDRSREIDAEEPDRKVNPLIQRDTPALRVVRSLLFKHGNQNREQSIGYTAQGSAVAVARSPQSMIVLATPVIVLHADTRPVIQDIA